MGFSSDVGPGFVFIDVFVGVRGEGLVVSGAVGRGVSWGCIATFSAVVFRAMSLKVSGLFASETGCVSHVARVNKRRGVSGFLCEINFSAEWVGLSFRSGSG